MLTNPKSKPNAVAMNSDTGISESFDVIDLEFNGEEIMSISHIIFKDKGKDDSKVKLLPQWLDISILKGTNLGLK